MINQVIFLGVFVAAYVAGSVNFSILVFRFTGREDPRQHGSGNPGATNVYRQAGLAWAAGVLLLDMGRAMAVALLATTLLPVWQIPWVGLGLIMGNHWPLFHRFQGGKGVANYLGFTVIITPVWALIGALAWGTAHLVWQTPFLSSFAMVLCLAVGTALVQGMGAWGGLGAAATVVFIVACHHANIRGRWGSSGGKR
jgi:glycerol-3-phosphate acyltransferase PlsY